MDRVVAARKLLGDLVKADQLELRRVEIVGRDLAKLCETLKRPPSGQELGEWLEEHPQVTDVGASSAVLDELINRHLVDPSMVAAVVAARNPELERELREDPSNPGAYLVYADWLQEHADPLGELIALGVASATGKDTEEGRFERHLSRYEAYFLGESAKELATRVQLRWRFGFVQAIDVVGDLDPVVWQRLLRLRVCELVESLSIRVPITNAVDAAITEAAPPSLRTLVLEQLPGTLPAELIRRPWRELSLAGKLPPLEPAFFLPSLERLGLYTWPLSSPSPLTLGVRELEVLATEENLTFLREVRLPRLERLSFIHVGSAMPSIVDLLQHIQAPALIHLAVRNGQLDVATFRALAELPRSAELRSLGLVNMGLTDQSIGPIAGVRGLSSLEQVDVTLNELTREGLETARELARTVVSTRQLRPGHGLEQRVRKLAGTRLQAAEEIADPAAWKRAGIDGDIRWARYRGEADYELFISADLSRYGCSCPSSIQPCKHVIALALVAGRTGLSPAPSHGIETRVTTRAGLTDLLVSSIDVDD